MKIKSIETFHASVPLHTPFKTALRTVTDAETIIVKITTSEGISGWGEAPPTHVITGESLSSIQFAISHVFRPILIGSDLKEMGIIIERLNRSMVHNSSAKAAVDMALYDCLAQHAGLPLYQYLGGNRHVLETDYTVSVNDREQMASDAEKYVNQGFSTLKIKVGKDQVEEDIERIRAIRHQVGPCIKLRLDANQGWKAKEAVKAIKKMESLDLDIELIEQPVAAADLDGLKYVTSHTDTPIMADESVFSPHDARRVLEMGAADLINIKLMKSGGIHQAVKIAKLADVYGVECMVGSMIETKIGISAAAHFAAGQKNVTRFDFDAPLMLSGEITGGGIRYTGSAVTFSDRPGLGIDSIDPSYLVNGHS